MSNKLFVALAMVAALSGCGIFKGRGDGRSKTAVVGERIPVLTSESDAEIEPSLAAIPVIAPAPTVNGAWAQPGGNAAKSMGNPALGASLRQIWSATIPGSSSKVRLAAGPVIADGRVYVIDTQAVVHAFSAANGARLWQAALAEKGKDSPSLFGGGVSFDGGKVYATDGLGDAAAFDAASGKPVWKVRPGGPLRGAPAIGGGNVYVLTQDNQIFALKPETGETVWTVAATLETAGVFGVSAPAIAQGTVVAGFSSGELSALRYENGRVVWQDQLSRTSISTSVSSISDVDASPVIDAGKVYAIGQGGRMVAMDLVSGQRLWEINIAGISTPALMGDWLFVVTDDARLLCIARATGKVRWITQLPHWKNAKKKTKPIGWSGPLLAGGRLLLVSTRGELIEVALADGAIGRTIPKAGKEFNLAPAVADSTLYLLDNKGRLTAWR